ncbi:MAG: Ig-like domain-containing protein [Candidatus Bathyarchaeota archaeon]|nr:Ig-like domain-containing protein [Candidatus Bathyarchaeota archaeon]
MNTTKLGICVCLAIVLSFAVAVVVEAAPTLSTSFYKNNGYGMGNDMSGEWTLNTSVSSDVAYVEFYLDDQLQLNATSAPFSWHFNTSSFTEGQHNFHVIAYDAQGASDDVAFTRNFVGFPVDFVVIIIVVVVVAVIVSLAVLLYRVKRQDAKRNNQ